MEPVRGRESRTDSGHASSPSRVCEASLAREETPGVEDEVGQVIDVTMRFLEGDDRVGTLKPRG
eukprot:7503321-Pyramimonas_sp.AAC.1